MTITGFVSRFRNRPSVCAEVNLFSVIHRVNDGATYVCILNVINVGTGRILFPWQVTGWIAHKIYNACGHQLTVVVLVKVTVFVMFNRYWFRCDLHLFAQFFRFTKMREFLSRVP